jgi:hypothetical protein
MLLSETVDAILKTTGFIPDACRPYTTHTGDEIREAYGSNRTSQADITAACRDARLSCKRHQAGFSKHVTRYVPPPQGGATNDAAALAFYADVKERIMASGGVVAQLQVCAFFVCVYVCVFFACVEMSVCVACGPKSLEAALTWWSRFFLNFEKEPSKKRTHTSITIHHHHPQLYDDLYSYLTGLDGAAPNQVYRRGSSAKLDGGHGAVVRADAGRRQMGGWGGGEGRHTSTCHVESSLLYFNKLPSSRPLYTRATQTSKGRGLERRRHGHRRRRRRRRLLDRQKLVDRRVGVRGLWLHCL